MLYLFCSSNFLSVYSSFSSLSHNSLRFSVCIIQGFVLDPHHFLNWIIFLWEIASRPMTSTTTYKLMIPITVLLVKIIGLE